MQHFEKRLQNLEKQLKVRATGGLWIDCHNKGVRIDSKAHISKYRVFDTPYDAMIFIEGVLNDLSHDNVFGSLVFGDIFQLYQDSEGLKKAVSEIMPLNEFTDRSGVVFGKLKTGKRTDIRLRLVQSLLTNFKSIGFYRRWHSGEFAESDKKLIRVCLELFQWERQVDPEDTWDLFAGLFFAVTGLASEKIASDYLTESEVI